MTVLIDATPLATGHRWRGIGRYVRALSSGVAQQLPDASRFLTVAGATDGLPPGWVVQFRSVMPPRWSDTWPLYTRSLRRLVENSRCSPYHFTSQEGSLSPGAFATVATVYDLIPLEDYHGSRDPRAIWRHYLYRRYLGHLRAATHLIAISQSTAQTIRQRLMVPADRITVIPLGIDLEPFLLARERSPSVRHRLELPESYWLSITSPNPNKGWPDLLRALGLVRQRGSTVPLVLAGYWLPKQRRQLIAEARALGVSDLLRFIGFVADDDLPPLYRGALGFIFPSHREGFGLPVLEAMAAGTPVIISDDPALLELTGAAALAFPRGDAAGLAEQMSSIARDPELRGGLARIGEERATHFRWRDTVAATIQVYARVTSG
jgi:glycosyltransferase involved in cell wall biosynthesis